MAEGTHKFATQALKIPKGKLRYWRDGRIAVVFDVLTTNDIGTYRRELGEDILVSVGQHIIYFVLTDRAVVIIRILS